VTEPQPTPQKTEKGTSYVVLEQDSESSDRFLVVTTITASSVAAALRKVGNEGGPGSYVAVPSRSFVPTKVTVETTKTVKLG
jgi:hypothetical protein